VSLLVVIVLFEQWSSIPSSSLTVVMANGMPHLLALAVGCVPKACVGALIGALVAREPREGIAYASIVAGIMGLCHFALQWPRTHAYTVRFSTPNGDQYTEVFPTHLVAESLVVALAVFAGYYAVRRWSAKRGVVASPASVPAHAGYLQAPLLRLALTMIVVTAVEYYVGRWVSVLLIMVFSALPEWLVPVWLAVVPVVFYFWIGRRITRRAWLDSFEAIVLVIYACAMHASIWLWQDFTYTGWLKIAVVAIPLLAIPLAYLAAYRRAAGAHVSAR
jgi:hypothetical protein